MRGIRSLFTKMARYCYSPTVNNYKPFIALQVPQIYICLNPLFINIYNTGTGM